MLTIFFCDQIIRILTQEKFSTNCLSGLTIFWIKLSKLSKRKFGSNCLSGRIGAMLTIFFWIKLSEISYGKKVLIKLCLRADCSNANHLFFGSNYQNCHTGEILIKVSLRAMFFLDQIIRILSTKCLTGRIAATLTIFFLGIKLSKLSKRKF